MCHLFTESLIKTFTVYSNAIAESSIPQNESGMYWGWKYSFSKKYSLAGYFDLFSFPWLRYRSYSPTEGSEWLVRSEEHTSELQSRFDLVCRLLLEKKK